ncbi:GntR family transcriptional regulator [Bombilactobacillus thymidiniphilus]|uniref:GntR family transcriptional regulator n=1 Tax=Bombilactobacillus thymidiniphilus TaxID=2923363 RepID=A0ABY4PBS9_9LACO|nr:GntR family transcriptional regulator [Bombilactobacillus thymidiniphilus]UQS82996.1 GntR family transcriptional regulator [Bombilactobacillus thymidiniphilus]
MTLKDTVYNFIAQQLVLGKIQRSEHLTEQSLAEQLGTSRTPIREALLQLEADGVLVRQAHKGFKIRYYTQKDSQELYTLIGLLDGKIAALASPYLTKKDYATMNFLVDSMDSAISNELFIKYNELQEQFHNVYLAKCPNDLLKRDLLNKKRSFIGKNYARLQPKVITDLLQATNQEHASILKLFQAHKIADLRHFIEQTHWSPQNSQYDIW